MPAVLRSTFTVVVPAATRFSVTPSTASVKVLELLVTVNVFSSLTEASRSAAVKLPLVLRSVLIVFRAKGSVPE